MKNRIGWKLKEGKELRKLMRFIENMKEKEERRKLKRRD